MHSTNLVPNSFSCVLAICVGSEPPPLLERYLDIAGGTLAVSLDVGAALGSREAVSDA